MGCELGRTPESGDALVGALRYYYKCGVKRGASGQLLSRVASWGLRNEHPKWKEQG